MAAVPINKFVGFYELVLVKILDRTLVRGIDVSLNPKLFEGLLSPRHLASTSGSDSAVNDAMSAANAWHGATSPAPIA